MLRFDFVGLRLETRVDFTLREEAFLGLRDVERVFRDFDRRVFERLVLGMEQTPKRGDLKSNPLERVRLGSCRIQT